jgi:hypothetical protein
VSWVNGARNVEKEPLGVVAREVDAGAIAVVDGVGDELGDEFEDEFGDECVDGSGDGVMSIASSVEVEVSMMRTISHSTIGRWEEASIETHGENSLGNSRRTVLYCPTSSGD